jgi:putative ABC transport system ATP-binding protein
VHALAGINVTIERGRPTSGQAFVGGQDVGRLDDAGLTRLRRDKIGFVFQSFNLVPTLTAAENITLPADLAGTKLGRPTADSILERMRTLGS